MFRKYKIHLYLLLPILWLAVIVVTLLWNPARAIEKERSDEFSFRPIETKEITSVEFENLKTKGVLLSGQKMEGSLFLLLVEKAKKAKRTEGAKDKSQADEILVDLKTLMLLYKVEGGSFKYELVSEDIKEEEDLVDAIKACKPGKIGEPAECEGEMRIDLDIMEISNNTLIVSCHYQGKADLIYVNISKGSAKRLLPMLPQYHVSEEGKEEIEYKVSTAYARGDGTKVVIVEGLYGEDRKKVMAFDESGMNLSHETSPGNRIPYLPDTVNSLDEDEKWMWSGMQVVLRIGSRNKVVYKPENWKGKEDLFFQVRTLKDEKKIQFFVKVDDDRLVKSNNEKKISDDQVIIWLGFSQENKSIWNESSRSEYAYYSTSYSYPEIYFKLGLLQSAEGKVDVSVLSRGTNKLVEGNTVEDEAGPINLEDSQAMIEKTPSGYLLSFQMTLPEKPEITHAKICVSDSDDQENDARKKMMCTSDFMSPLVPFEITNENQEVIKLGKIQTTKKKFCRKPHITKNITENEYKKLKRKKIILTKEWGKYGAEYYLVAEPIEVPENMERISIWEDILPAEIFYPDREAQSLLYKIGGKYYIYDFYKKYKKSKPQMVNKFDACKLSKEDGTVFCYERRYSLSVRTLGKEGAIIRHSGTEFSGKWQEEEGQVNFVDAGNGNLCFISSFSDSGGSVGCDEGYHSESIFEIKDINHDGKVEIIKKYSDSGGAWGYGDSYTKYYVYDIHGNEITDEVQWNPDIFTGLCHYKSIGIHDEEWDRVPEKVISKTSTVVWQPKNWAGPDDLSFKVKALTSDAYLYFRVEVKDDTLVTREEMRDIYKDHVELWLYFSAPRPRLFPEYYYPTGKIQLGIIPSSDEEAKVKMWKAIFLSDSECEIEINKKMLKERWCPNIKRVSAEYEILKGTESGYVMLIKVPHPETGMIRRAAVCISDNDDPDVGSQKTMMCTYPKDEGFLRITPPKKGFLRYVK